MTFIITNIRIAVIQAVMKIILYLQKKYLYTCLKF